MTDQQNSPQKRGGLFSTPISTEERAQIRQMAKFLATVLFFVIMASLIVGFIVTQLN